jgi:hypothetical protein
MDISTPLVLALPTPPKLNASQEETFRYNIALLDALSIIIKYIRDDINNLNIDIQQLTIRVEALEV